MGAGQTGLGEGQGYCLSTAGRPEKSLSREDTNADSHWVRRILAATRSPDRSPRNNVSASVDKLYSSTHPGEE